MPKKATAVTVAKAAPLSLVNLSGSLNVNDILSVVTSRAETTFHKELAKAKKVLEDANAHRKAIAEQLYAAYRKEYNAIAQALVAAIKPAIEALGGKVSVTKLDDHTAKSLSRTDGKIVASVSVLGNVEQNSYYNAKFQKGEDPSEAFLALEADLKKADEAVTEAQNVALGWRQKLAQIPVLERRSRAKIAEAKLAESEDGTALLDMLTKDLESEYLALPSLS